MAALASRVGHADLPAENAIARIEIEKAAA
jgi:hypothetical protein